MIKNTISIATLTLLFSQASQGLVVDNLKNSAKATYRSPQGLTEICVSPRRWAGANFTDSDTKKENTLCAYDFHSNVGVCPKYSSTNPGLMIIEPDSKFSKSAIDSSNCELKKMGLKTDAKFKQSITCSYTPAILAYYPVSRILGDVGRVPVSVLRTMDLRTHRSLTEKANSYLKDKNLAIKASWAMYNRVHAAPASFPLLVDSTGQQMYGALSDNVRGEEQYVEVSGVGVYETRYQRFLQQRPYKLVSGNNSPSQIVGSRDFKALAQTTLLMKDVSDMVILDTMMNQQDRIGNIHYKFVWYTINPRTQALERFKSKAKLKDGKLTIPTEEQSQYSDRTAVLLKEMILKDNDCGITKTNMMRRHSAIEGLRHVSYRTYANLLRFESSLNGASAREYFKRDLLFTDADFETLRRNTVFAKQTLQNKCRTGELKFDIDLEDYIPGTAPMSKGCGN